MGLAWPNETAARARAYNARLEHVPFFKFNGADDATMRRLPQIFQKNIWRITYISRRYIACSNPKFGRCDSQKNKVHCFITQKSHFHPEISFSPHFWLKIPREHFRDRVKPIYSHQKAKKPPKTLKSTWNKNSSRTQIYYFRCLQGKKKNTLHNSYHHTKLSTCLLYYPRFSLQSLCFQFNLFS
jgi:hypothetical protein